MMALFAVLTLLYLLWQILRTPNRYDDMTDNRIDYRSKKKGYKP